MTDNKSSICSKVNAIRFVNAVAHNDFRSPYVDDRVVEQAAISIKHITTDGCIDCKSRVDNILEGYTSGNPALVDGNVRRNFAIIKTYY